MKYNVGDRIRIKSLDWYNENKDEYGYIDCGSRAFFTKMSDWCGKIVTIKEICKTNCYRLEEYDFDWTDEMIEGLVEEEVGLVDELSSRWVNEFNLPEGYIFKDENGNVINAMKIVLEKKTGYPKTYEECCKVLGILNVDLCFNADYRSFDASKEQWKRLGLMNQFYQLLICRDAYWKLYGDEMGLGKPWEPQDTNTFSIFYDRLTGEIQKQDGYCGANSTLEFSTAEMRDDFKKNFDPDIEICKELL